MMRLDGYGGMAVWEEMGWYLVHTENRFSEAMTTYGHVG